MSLSPKIDPGCMALICAYILGRVKRGAYSTTLGPLDVILSTILISLAFSTEKK